MGQESNLHGRCHVLEACIIGDARECGHFVPYDGWQLCFDCAARENRCVKCGESMDETSKQEVLAVPQPAQLF